MSAFPCFLAANLFAAPFGRAFSLHVTKSNRGSEAWRIQRITKRDFGGPEPIDPLPVKDPHFRTFEEIKRILLQLNKLPLRPSRNAAADPACHAERSRGDEGR